MKTGREAGAGAWCFLEVNDGSCLENLQVLVSCISPTVFTMLLKTEKMLEFLLPGVCKACSLLLKYTVHDPEWNFPPLASVDYGGERGS